MIIDIIRHAETFANQEGRLQGNSDLLLSRRGIEQAQSIQREFKNNYDLIFCSSMRRTQQTLNLLIGKSISESTDSVEQFGKIILSDHLREMDLGILEGKIIAEMNTKERKMLKQLQIDPNFNDHLGESPLKFYNRVNSFFTEINNLASIDNFDKILIMTHKGVIQALMKYILNISTLNSIQIGNADMLRFEIIDGVMNFKEKISVEATVNEFDYNVTKDDISIQT